MKGRQPWVSARAGAAVAILATVSGCGSSQDTPAETAATSFYRALDTGDETGACAWLAPKTREELEKSSSKDCPNALRAETVTSPGAFRDVTVYGTMAQIRYAEETVFVTRFRSGWRVMALGCTPQAVGPYDCEIKGA
ncbi:MAG: hypothetical protein JWO11_3897 [Nocardioides sp.]|nr:hypothetical protein [Nocardioides sp.]